MLLHELKPNNPLKNKRARVGQGGKRGNTSGRGQKGQKSRSGHRIRPAERDLIIRLPKLRGYKNKPMSEAHQVVKLSDLIKLEGGKISKSSLAEAGLIKNPNDSVKILNEGDVSKAFTVSGDVRISKTAKEKIVKAGGSVINK